MQLTVRADTTAASRRLETLAGRLTNAAPAFAVIADDLRDQEVRHFATLPRLAPQTAAAKARSEDPRLRANANRPLVATGETYRSLTTRGSGAVQIIQASRLTFGTSVPQARFHQPDRQGRRVLDVDRRPVTARMRSFLLQTTRGPA